MKTDAPPTDKAYAFYVDETFHSPHGYIPAVVYEDTSGYWPMIGSGELAEPWYWGEDISTAKRICEEANEGLGISPERAREIVTSSIAAALTEDARTEAAEERWAQIRTGKSAAYHKARR